AWFSLARGALAQADILERFKSLYDTYAKLIKTHAGCEETVKKLVTTRVDLRHNADLYKNMSERYTQVKGEHDGCVDKL
nr:hypothetical protein [Tanacetum cinerariifolium]